MRESPFQPEPVFGGNPVPVYRGPRTGIDAVDKVLAGIASDPFGGVNAHPMAGAVTANGVANLLRRQGIMGYVEDLLRSPRVAEKLNEQWKDVGHSGKEILPEFVGGGVDAVAMKVKPYNRGGELLKIFRRPLDYQTSTSSLSARQAIDKAPEDFLLKHRLKGDIGREGQPAQAGWTTQPIAEPLTSDKQINQFREILKSIGNKQGWSFLDAHSGNFGTFRGRPIIWDEGSVSPQMMNSTTWRVNNADNTSEAMNELMKDPHFLSQISDNIKKIINKFGSGPLGKTKVGELLEQGQGVGAVAAPGWKPTTGFTSGPRNEPIGSSTVPF